MNVPRKSILALSIAAAVAACGGGSGKTASTDDSGSTPTATAAVTSSGVITGFGSVYVNGVRYDTATAEVEFEGEGMKTEDDLRLGMRVRIKASRDGEDRVASQILFDKDLKGPVSMLTPDTANPAIGTLKVLGQTVTVDAYTVFDSNVGDVNVDGQIDIQDLEDPSGRVVVEVSGFPAESGFIATRVERINVGEDDEEYEVKGFVAQLDTTAGTFMLGELVVSYEASDLEADDFPDASLSAGAFVEVEGVLLADGSLDAIQIELEDDGLGDDEEREGEFEIEGVLRAVDITSVPNTITINGTVIAIADASALVGMEGSKIELEGEFSEAGVLVLDAEEGIKREMEDNLSLEDRIETVGETSFTTRLGVTVTPTGTSRVEDDVEEGGDRLKPEQFMARLQVGDFIEAKAYVAEDGSVAWTRIEREDEDEQGCSLEGPIDAGSIDASTGIFAIQGVTVDTSAMVEAEAFGGDGIIGRDSFFAAVSAGSVVEVSGDAAEQCSSGLLVAGEVELDAEAEAEAETDASGEAESESEEQDSVTPDESGSSTDAV